MAWDAGTGSNPRGSHAELAERWVTALGSGAHHHVVPVDAVEAQALLTELAGELITLAHARESADRAADIGAQLARAHFVGDEVLGRSITVLNTHFAELGTVATPRVARLLGAFVTGYMGAFRVWLLRERLQYRAHHDQLTGLPNRSRFFDALTTAFAEPTARIGLCYIDLDHFKTVNDTSGHAVGDELLVRTASRLSTCVTGPDQLVAHMGGDEFVILVPQSGGIDEVATLARSILEAFAQPFEVHGRYLVVTASIGVIEERADRTTPGELLRAADSTMYWAKAAGRGRYATFDADRNRREHTRAELSAAMPIALARGEFFLDYQPIVELADRQLVAVEALVRWRHPKLGVLTPGRFIELAEDNGQIGALGTFVLEHACRDIRRWTERTPTISVNVSAVEVSDPAWLDRVQSIVADTGIDPNRLQLELTERVFMHAAGQPLHALYTLAEAGIRIAIDDFGTGYSNLAYLGQLPLHVVKLAGPFIHRIRTPETASPVDLLVLEKIINLAHTLGFTVTAECVETRHQAERLHDLGCDTAQGWHFHRPMPADRVSHLLTTPKFAFAQEISLDHLPTTDPLC